MKATITLSSKKYGKEKFEYPSIKEANVSFDSLSKACNACIEYDKVERELVLKTSNGKIHRSEKIVKKASN